MNSKITQIKVVKTESLIDGMAKSVYFEIATDDTEQFSWKAGQHITLLLDIDGKQVRRSYSISSSPTSGDLLRISVKRVKSGLVSNYINDRINAGDVLNIMQPFGGFILNPGSELRRTHYFFGAGSGVTPLFSMIHTMLCSEPYSVAHLVYGNKNHKSILFKEKFQQLIEQYPDRITVSHVLSDPSMWSSEKYWKKGIVDKTAVTEFINEFKPYAQDTQYYICGPGGMNKSVKSALMQLDVPSTRIHMENYGGNIVQDESIKGIASEAEIQLNNNIQTVQMQTDQTVLEAAKKSGITAPYSCESGLCGACKAHLKKGKVHMRANLALEDSEVDKGYILTCQSVALTKKLELSYDT